MSDPTNNYPGQSSPDVKGVSKPKSTPPAPKPSASGGSNLLDNIPSSLGSGGNVWGSPMGKQLLPMAGMLASQNPLLGGSILAAGLGPKDWQTLMSKGPSSAPTLGGFSSKAVENFRNKVSPPPASPQSGGYKSWLGTAGTALGNVAGSAMGLPGIGTLAHGLTNMYQSNKFSNPLAMFQKRGQDNVKPPYAPKFEPIPQDAIKATNMGMVANRLGRINKGTLDPGTAAGASPNTQDRWGGNPALFASDMRNKPVGFFNQQLQEQHPSMTAEQSRELATKMHAAAQVEHPSYAKNSPFSMVQWDGGITPLVNYLTSDNNVATRDLHGADPRRFFPGYQDSYKGHHQKLDEYIAGTAYNPSRPYFERAPETWPTYAGELGLDALGLTGREIGLYSGNLSRLHPAGGIMHLGVEAAKSPWTAYKYMKDPSQFRSVGEVVRGTPATGNILQRNPVVRAVTNPMQFARQSQAVAGTGRAVQGTANLLGKLPGVAGTIGSKAPVAAARWLGPAAGAYTLYGDAAANLHAIHKARPEEMGAVLGSQGQRYFSDSYDQNTGMFGTGDDGRWYSGADEYLGKVMQGLGQPTYAAQELVAGLADTPALLGFQGYGDHIRGQKGHAYGVDFSSDIAKQQAVMDAQAQLDYVTNADNRDAINAQIDSINKGNEANRINIQQQMLDHNNYAQQLGDALTLAESDPAQFAAGAAQNQMSPQQYAEAIRAEMSNQQEMSDNLQGNLNAQTYTYDKLVNEATRGVHRSKRLRDTYTAPTERGPEALERTQKDRAISAEHRLESLRDALGADGRFRQDPEAMADMAAREEILGLFGSDPAAIANGNAMLDLVHKGPDAWLEEASTRLDVYTDPAAREMALAERNKVLESLEGARATALEDIAANNERGQALDAKWQSHQASEFEKAKAELPRAQQAYEESKDPMAGINLRQHDLVSRATQQRKISVNKAKALHEQMKKMKAEFGGNYSSWSSEQRDQFDELARGRQNALGAMKAIDKIQSVISEHGRGDAASKALRSALGQALSTANEYGARPRSDFTDLVRYTNEEKPKWNETEQQFADRRRRELESWTGVRDTGAMNRGRYELLRRLAAQQNLDKVIGNRRNISEYDGPDGT